MKTLAEMDFGLFMKDWGLPIIGAFIVLTAIYTCIVYACGKIVVSTKVKDTDLDIEADQLYFLPAASLHMTATAKIAVNTEQNTGNFISSDIYEFQLDTTVQVMPDSGELYTLDYKPNWFTSDDLKLSTDVNGLLSNIAIVAEDRFSAILTQLTDAPKKILSPQSSAAFVAAMAAGTQVNTTFLPPFTRTFVLYPDDLLKEEKDMSWQITLDSSSTSQRPPVDASFRLTLGQKGGSATRKAITGGKTFNGLFTRPLRNLKMDVYLNAPGSWKPGGASSFQSIADAHYEFMIPDVSRLLSVPIQRSPFVKKTVNPKFSGGLLIENDINKPSELENAISIPINVAKAIFSIPAQLLSFKIAHITQESSLETAQKKLITDRQATKKAVADAEKDNLAAAKTNISTNKDLLAAQQEWEKTKTDMQDMLQKIQSAQNH